MKAQPIGMWLLPGWAKLVLAGVEGAAVLTGVVLLARMLIETSDKWAVVLMFLILLSHPGRMFLRYKSVMPRLRNPDVMARVRRFQGLKTRNWESMLEELRHDLSVEILGERRAVMANPLTWGRRGSILSVKTGEVLADISECNGKVASVILKLIRED